MLDEINAALVSYHQKWHNLVITRSNRAFFEALQPTAVGWKVADRADYDRIVAELHDHCERIHQTWMNDRWIAKLVLKEPELAGNIRILKVMLRRPDSKDALGLDHVDFYHPDAEAIKAALADELDLNLTQESNEAIAEYNWSSLWFDGCEAKIKPYTVIDIIAQEMTELHEQIVSRKSQH